MRTVDELIELEKSGELEGVFYDLPEEVYHHRDCPGINNSKMDLTKRGINHFRKGIAYAPTISKEMMIGTAIHQAVLQPHRFSLNYIAMDKLDRRTKEGKAQQEEMVEILHEKPWVTFLDKDQYNNVIWAASRVWEHPTVQALLSEGRPEVTLFWKDLKTGLLCKGRVDWLRPDGIIVDLKSVIDSGRDAFQKNIYQRNHDRAAAFYLEGATRLLKQVYDVFIFVVVERDDPFDVNIYSLDEDDIRFGREMWERDLPRYHEYLKMGQLGHVYNQAIQSITTPAWSRNLGVR